MTEARSWYYCGSVCHTLSMLRLHDLLQARGKSPELHERLRLDVVDEPCLSDPNHLCRINVRLPPAPFVEINGVKRNEEKMQLKRNNQADKKNVSKQNSYQVPAGTVPGMESLLFKAATVGIALLNRYIFHRRSLLLNHCTIDTEELPSKFFWIRCVFCNIFS